MRNSLLIVCLLSVCAYVWSIPATREPIIRLSDDGRPDTVYLHGDEHNSFVTDTRGRILVRDGVLSIAESERVRQRIAAAKAPQQKMLKSYVPSSGTVRIPVLLVNFADYSFTLPDAIAQFDDLFNGKGGSNPKATGSVYDYYTASSDSALSLAYDVFGIYTLSHNMEYYGENVTDASGVVTSHNKRARELVTEAVQLAVKNGVDFSLYDNNNDGYIDNVSIVVAGYNEAEGGEERTIWPHYSTISNSDRYSGKYLSGYLMISEYRSSGGQIQAGIGTYCHEFGHALGLPDLYDVSNSDNYTVGNWDVMCSGSYNNDGSTPPTYTAFERFMMGWMTPTQVTSGLHVLEPIERSNEALLIAAEPHNLNANFPNPTEYFLLENRQKTGWDAGNGALVATGLLVSHVTFDLDKWDRNRFNSSQPLGFAIVSAGLETATKSTAADVFPGTTKRTSWLPTLNDGTLLNHLYVSQIRERNDSCISLQVGEVGRQALSFDQEEVSLTTTYYYNPEEYDTAKVSLLIDSLTQDTVLLSVSSKHFRFSVDEGKSWHSENDTVILRVLQDSTYSVPVWAIHTPQRKHCDNVYAFMTAETTDVRFGAQMTLAGRAPRVTLITTPSVDSVKNVLTSSFNVYWTEQEDAQGYYYTLYTISEGESEEVDSASVVFNRTGLSMQSARYLYAPDRISIGITNNYTPNIVDSVIGGKLTIWGTSDGETWEQASTIYVFKTTKDIVRDIDLDTTRQWKQFRMDYTHLGGYGGTTVSNWTAHFAMNISYLYPLEENYIYAPANELLFRDLSAGTTYYYAMQAYEEKGCEPHYSALNEPVAIKTKTVPEKPTLIVHRDENGHYTVELPELADGLHTLAMYDYNGQLVYSTRPNYGTTLIALPTMTNGQAYMLKYFTGRMGRKDMSTKVFYY